MMNGQSMFKGAFGWDDWLWWIVLGSVALLVLLLLVCCCVCMQRAKRKGREEALASVQNHQRRTQARELAEHQRYQPSQQTSYQPPVTGPQVAANGYRESPSQRPNEQFSKPYPPLPAQQMDQTHRNPPDHFYNSNVKYAPSTNSSYPDNIRYDDIYAMSVTSPSSNRLTVNRSHGMKASSSQVSQVTLEARNDAVPMKPRPSGATLQARIDALRSADNRDMVHTRISFNESDRPDSIDLVGTLRSVPTQESYMSRSARHSGLMMNSTISSNSTTMVSSRIASPSSSSRSYESTDRNMFNSSKFTEREDMSSRSYRSDLSHSQYDDDDKMALSEKAATPMTSSSPKETLVRGSVEF
ncbi:hypothetical protein Plhal304r1_c008g0032221 [Plasmopara halstedii]